MIKKWLRKVLKEVIEESSWSRDSQMNKLRAQLEVYKSAWERQKDATGTNYWHGYNVGYDDAKNSVERRTSKRY